jgi:hypothetical protein
VMVPTLTTRKPLAHEPILTRWGYITLHLLQVWRHGRCMTSVPGWPTGRFRLPLLVTSRSRGRQMTATCELPLSDPR